MLLILCFLSGFSVLVYEIIWARQLTLIFGGTVIATTVVIAVFMAGLGFGSIFFGKRVDRTTHPLKLFSIVQFGICISSTLAFFTFGKLAAFHRILNLALKGSSVSTLFIILISSLFMLIPTFLAGGTLPIISKELVNNRNRIGRGVGWVYAVYTLGSMFGAFVTGFFLIAHLGQALSLMFAVVINLLLGFGSRLWLTNKVSTTETPKDKSQALLQQPMSSNLLVIVGLIGFCGLAYEILWTRALYIFLANSTYSFTSILIVFLFGITLGSILFAKFFDANKQPIALLATCQTIIGLFVILGAFLLNDLPGLLFSIRSALQVPVLRMILPGLLLSFIIGFIPTLCMGISFPLLCKLLAPNLQNLGKNVGKAFFISTMGSIVGSLIAGFLLIPVFGIVKSLISVAFINLGVGLFLLVVLESKKKMRFVIAESCALVIALFLTWSAFGKHMVLPPSMFRSKMRADRILFYIETSQGTVIVNEDKLTGIRACYINNSAVCGTTYDALKVVRLLGHLPFFINPDADTVLIIGFGIGITSSAVAEHDVTNIDCIEICPGVKAAAKFFSRFNKDVVADPRVKFISEDGRHYVLLTNKKYDIISCDPTHPTLGCNNLYTKEYFVNCRRLLNPGGVICQYLPLHKLSLDEFKTLIRTFSSVFPHTSVWLAHSHGILLGHDRSIQFDFNEFSKHLFGLDDDILDDPYLIASSLILDENSVHNFTADARINTDDRPILEFFTPSSLRRENWHINLIELLNHRSDVTNTFTNIDDQGKMNRYLKGQNLFLSSLVYKNKGDIARSIRALKAAAKINPENNEILSILNSESR